MASEVKGFARLFKLGEELAAAAEAAKAAHIVQEAARAGHVAQEVAKAAHIAEEATKAARIAEKAAAAAHIAKETAVAGRAMELDRVAVRAAEAAEAAAARAAAAQVKARQIADLEKGAAAAARAEGAVSAAREAQRIAGKAEQAVVDIAKAERLAAERAAVAAANARRLEQGAVAAANARRLEQGAVNARRLEQGAANARRLEQGAVNARRLEQGAANARRLEQGAANARRLEQGIASGNVRKGTLLTQPRQAVAFPEPTGTRGFATRPGGPLSAARKTAGDAVAASKQISEEQAATMAVKDLVGDGKKISTERYKQLVEEYFTALKSKKPTNIRSIELMKKGTLGPIKDADIIRQIILEELKKTGHILGVGEAVAPRLAERASAVVGHLAEAEALDLGEAGVEAAGLLRRGSPAGANLGRAAQEAAQAGRVAEAAQAGRVAEEAAAAVARAPAVTAETARAIETATAGITSPLKQAGKVAEKLGESAKSIEVAATGLKGEAKAAQELAAASQGSTAAAAATKLEKEAQIAARVTTPAEAAEMGSKLGGVPASDAKAVGDASVSWYERIFGKTSIIYLTKEGMAAAAALSNAEVIARKGSGLSFLQYIMAYTPYGRSMSGFIDAVKLGAANIARFEVVARNMITGANVVATLPKYNEFAEQTIRMILEHATSSQISRLTSVFTPQRMANFKTALVRVFQTNPVDAGLVLDTMLTHIIPNSKYNVELIDALINTMKNNPSKAVDEMLKINGLITVDAIKTVGASAAAYHKGMGWFKSKSYYSLLAAGLGSSVLFLANYNNIPDMKTFAEEVYWGKEKVAEQLEDDPNYSTIKKRAANLRKAATLAVVRQFDPEYAAELEEQQAAANEAAAAAKAAREEAKKTWFAYIKRQIGIDESVNGRKKQKNLETMGKKAGPILVAAGVGVAATTIGIPPPLAAALGSAAAAAASPPNQKPSQAPRLRL
jgi:hypothetical protein